MNLAMPRHTAQRYRSSLRHPESRFCSTRSLRPDFSVGKELSSVLLRSSRAKQREFVRPSEAIGTRGQRSAQNDGCWRRARSRYGQHHAKHLRRAQRAVPLRRKPDALRMFRSGEALMRPSVCRSAGQNRGRKCSNSRTHAARLFLSCD